MSQFAVHRSWRWLGAGHTALSWSDDGLQLHAAKGQPLEIDWQQVTRPPRIETRWLGYALVLTSASGSHRIRVWRRPAVAGLARALTLAWYRAQLPLVNAIMASARPVLTGDYCRRSQWRRLLQQLQPQLAALPPRAELPELEEEIRQQFELAWALAEGDERLLADAREQAVQRSLSRYRELFDRVEKLPLTDSQRRACVVDEDHNLVLAGAGTGKTSTTMGRVAYLVASGKARPEEILLLAFGNKAAKEMQERLQQRLGIEGALATTFHALGKQIIAKVAGRAPSISAMAEDERLRAQFVNARFEALQQQPAYRDLLLAYFERYLFPNKNPFDFKSEGEYFQFLADNEVRSLKGEAVKSFAECQIANFLFRMGVDYRYEAPYAIDTATPDCRQYQPDFYLPGYDLYLEHFGLDRDGNTAPYIDRAEYHKGMSWKRQLHQQHGTRLIETYHYEQQEGQLLQRLSERLQAAGVVFEPLPPEAVLATLREFGAISHFGQLLAQMLSQMKAANQQPSKLIRRADDSGHYTQLSAAAQLLAPIYDSYQQQLAASATIDFDDMINLAIDHVDSGRFVVPWRYLLVDEFQDISAPRARLLKALRQQQPDGSLFCVGDDWQSIYRFAGSDIRFTAQFSAMFGATATTTLAMTFRFNSGINAVASRFVMQNPAQVAKQLTTLSESSRPTVSLLRQSLGGDGERQALERVLQKISQLTEPGSSVYLLARFRHQLPDQSQLATLQRRFGQQRLLTDTLHASKGKEADYVVLLGLASGKHGFPSTKVTHPLLEALLPPAEEHPFAEERRLFYVGLTRARQRVYLICDMSAASPFVTELINGSYPVELNEFETSIAQQLFQLIHCPKCTAGVLTERESRDQRRRFLGCSNYPRCDHAESLCPKCQQPMRRQQMNGEPWRHCLNPECGHQLPLCPVCGRDLVLRSGPGGRSFWGCSGYRGQEPLSCSFTRTLPKSVKA